MTMNTRMKAALVMTSAGMGVSISLGAVLAAFVSAQTPTLGARAGSQTAPQAAEAARALVRVEAQATRRDGATGAQSAALARRLSPGQALTGYLVAAPHTNPTACEVGRVTTGDEAAEFRVAWQVRASLVQVEVEEVTLDVEWIRLQEAPARVPGNHRRLTLREGDIHVLDLAGVPEGGGNPCANVVLRVSATVAVPPDLARRMLAYEVWLVHEGADGTRRVERQRDLVGRHGEAVSFHLRPLSWGLIGGLVVDGGDALELDVAGTLTGTVLPDGRVSVLLRANPRLVFGRTAVSGRMTKRLTLVGGETVAVVLPSPAGRLRGEGVVAGETLARGMTMEDTVISIDLASFFESSRTSLLLTVRPEP